MAGRSLKQIFSREEYFLPVATNPINLRQKTGLARKPKSKKNFLSHKWTLFLVLFVALISGGLGAGLAFVLSSRPFQQRQLSVDEAAVFNRNSDSMTSAIAGVPTLTRPVNILVLGTIMLTSDLPDAQSKPKGKYLAEVDNNLNGMSDAMLLIRFDPTTQKVAVLSIPRDSRVNIQGVGTTKINFANYAGGASLSAQTVSQVLGDIPIDRYIRFNVNGFGKLVDALGGIDIYVPKKLKYQDDSQHLYINLNAGQQKLNGSKAVQYMRYRHDDLGDIGRVQRQQAFFRAFIDQKLNPEFITKFPEILAIVKDNIDTNLSVEEVLALASYTSKVDRKSIQMHMAPGRFSNPGEFDNLSYWILDNRLLAKLMSQNFGLMKSADPSTDNNSQSLRVAIQDSMSQPEGTKKATTVLSRAGYAQVFAASDRWTKPIAKTQIIAQNGDRASAEKLRDALGIGEVLVESTGDIESDITVRVGKDWLQANNIPLKPVKSIPSKQR
ncbi:MAG: LCP family protein [Pseudanabaena sp. M57BS1SP1A06MG]|jgi:LCP family protein required for cell wall assembly|nr:LCP family protein [Pseudanabaena sp. M53BS1SP1A06MG]MCA6584421.1 LCP family protein [Pseudanabaena sp. M34BS1SP1A06MG]MCA6587518.1 LCP family protein [Pseudanabaena sp. M051S1SP1A06QC]MCA6592753.1 LCP family protein [Pseudanabaena sp. M38BS1SP1A06MG]MCA6597408.1 LCP family protein [Pseudanabaena sp. M046S1SP1A06QC]MCA6601174.1 LCP family protein [Pseudanabaena sp. M57BS1SP1A06MG]